MGSGEGRGSNLLALLEDVGELLGRHAGTGGEAAVDVGRVPDGAHVALDVDGEERGGEPGAVREEHDTAAREVVGLVGNEREQARVETAAVAVAALL